MALAKGNSVISIDRVAPASPAEDANLSFVQADITDFDALVDAFRGCDAVAHIAAIASPGRHPDYVVHNNNVTGSYNALRAAVEVGIQHICQASSVNATGLAYSRWPRFDYFPLDEKHPTYSEDPYSLSKWICEEQANSFARRYENLTISSLRYHWVVPDRATAVNSVQYHSESERASKNLWAYTSFDASARACLLALEADFKGHEVFYIVAPESASMTPSQELRQKFYSDVPVRGDLSGHRSFFDSGKAERMLGWKHD
jgi:UDP-glucose 4-epimerase